MKRIVIIITFVFCNLIVLAQDKTTDELKTLSENQQYDQIIEQYASNFNEYSAKSLYYIGLAYYMKEADNDCIKFMDLSIAKDNKNPAPYYIKASTLNYTGKYDDAIKNFQTAISLDSDDANFYSGLGDAYYQLGKSDLALENYKKATKLNQCPDRPYFMIPLIYANLKQHDKALDAYYIAKTKVSKKSNSYINLLFNIGLLESSKGGYDNAELAFVELLQLIPNDYHSYAKLIQIYYYKKEYDKAKPYKDKLYEAHKQGLLKDNLKDMFCFDQFKWQDYSVQAFERYENENNGQIYNKHIFYVMDNSNKIVLRVQTEFSPISIELGGAKYLLCATKGAVRYNSGIGFNDDFKYEILKAEAIKLFEKYIK